MSLFGGSATVVPASGYVSTFCGEGVEPDLVALPVGRWLDSYDEGADSRTRDDVGAVIGGVNGSINLTHPTACAALAEAAVAAGATVCLGVGEVRVSRNGFSTRAGLPA
jgi:hypothetical protein